MSHPDIPAERLTCRNDRPLRPGSLVLYWMQQSQRATANHALDFAIGEANALGLPVVVGFGLTPAYPGANARHYQFMLEGLRETEQALRARGIALVVRLGEPPEVALELARAAALVVCDRGYLPVQRRWREQVARHAPCRVVEVESDAVVPVEAVSDHVEYAARTLRPKIWRLVDRFARLPQPVPVAHPSLSGNPGGLVLSNPAALVRELGVDVSVPPVRRFRGGADEAYWRLDEFLAHRLARYDDEPPDLTGGTVSQLAPYLHFGQISPLEILLRLPPSAAGFREQLVVRRELALNYAWFQPAAGTYASLPAWARETLAAHAADRREPQYTAEEMEQGRTADPHWNAAMAEMRHSGYLHNHLRMYWGKQILLWSAIPEEAFATVSRLNDRYFLDGRDPNSLASVAWLFGQHDRPWPERPVFGKVRSMTRSGLERKTDTAAYRYHAEQVRRAET
ncbi:MAG: deoxyribodipyrimidine photo-lyase [Lentisphaeria bacterium]|jgi:deoxyribodipyrimidine photo-lyase|nr:deoxyribodipyrimidine photo-lyase [Lentisphaeria bacterium]